MKEEHYLYMNHSTLSRPPGFLVIALGLWIQEKLPGNASLVLGAIEMFPTVPTMHSRISRWNPEDAS